MTFTRTARGRMPRAVSRLAVAGTAVGLVCGLVLAPTTVNAYGVRASDTSQAVTGAQTAETALTGGQGDGEDEESVSPPTEKDLQAQREYLARLKDDVGKHSDALVKAQADQAAAAAAAAAAMEEYVTAERALTEAQAEETRQRDRLLQLQLQLAQQKAALGRWARAAYREGQLGADYGAVLTVLSAEPTDDLSNLMASLNRIGRSRSRTVELYVQARTEQAAATEAAAAATEQAVTAATAAEAAKRKRDAALEQQQRAVIALKEQLSVVQGEEAKAAKQLTVMEEQVTRASRYLTDRGTAGAVGDCKGGDMSRYPNGQIPVEALCPLWGAAGHRLRADAAYAFSQLSQAYAEAFGSPICITDSYRTYEQQVDLYRRKPHLAARPGTSNHGWGTATDLCGGIQSFSTAQHRWMVANGPAFGWFHPSWARQGGSKPEPWHFEYGG